jgi:hypothetical protein
MGPLLGLADYRPQSARRPTFLSRGVDMDTLQEPAAGLDSYTS